MHRITLAALVVLACVIAPAPAHAIPVAYLVSKASFALGVSFSTAMAVVTGALNLAGSFLFSQLAGRLFGPKQRRVRAEVIQPTEKPPYRYVYGRTLAPGTPFAYSVRNEFLYIGVILNSRPSALTDFKVHFDKRPGVIDSGDPFDFDGDGAVVVPEDENDNFGAGTTLPRVWIGRGDQVKAPDVIVDETEDTDYPVLTTDAWQGRTVMWVRIGAGKQETLFDRWPNSYRTLIEVEGDFSFVWDPRDAAQDPDDPATWTWSENQALCLLDAILQNPIRRYTRDHVQLDTFIAGADLAAETVPLYYDSAEEGVWPGDPLTVSRYTVGGLLAWTGAELVDQVSPLALAGAGEVVKIGGKLAYSSGAARPTSYIITDVLGDDLSYESDQPGSSIPTAVRVAYSSKARNYEEADLPFLPVDAGSTQVFSEGIQEIDAGFVTEPTQGMRVQKIVRNRVAAQRRISCILPPDAIKCVAGTVVEWAVPGVSFLNGRYRVVDINPSIWLADEESGEVALRCPVTLAEEPDDLDAWDPETDEFEIVNQVFGAGRGRVSIPVENLAANPGDKEAFLGGNTFVVLTFDIHTLASAAEWQWRVAGDAGWGDGGVQPVPPDESAGISPVAIPYVQQIISTPQFGGGFVYEFRVRAIYSDRPASEWRETFLALAPPNDGSATGGAVTEYEESGQWYRQHVLTDGQVLQVHEAMLADLVLRDSGAGGGRSANANGGGGGAGGNVLAAQAWLPVGDYPAVIGAPGAAGTSAVGNRGGDGGKTVFAGLSPAGAGAGGGGSWGSGNGNGSDGSSGGGAYGLNGIFGGAGDPGGNGGNAGPGSQGGGGGGPGGDGGNAPSSNGSPSGSGGAGVTLWDGPGSGGGSGGTGDGSGNSVGATSHGGGLGGAEGQPGQDGQLPGAGGGGGGSNLSNGGAGAPGRVAVRYRIPTPSE